MRLMTDEVIVLHKGKVSTQTSPDNLARQRMGWTRAGYINLLKLSDPSDEDGLFAYRWNGTRLLIGAGGAGESLFELSSKDIMLFRGRPEAISARNLLRCQAVCTFELDGRIGVELACGSERLIAQVVKPAAEELDIQPGREIYAVIKASAFRRLY
jgi:molybdate transport system ATP-binding protein